MASAYHNLDRAVRGTLFCIRFAWDPFIAKRSRRIASSKFEVVLLRIVPEHLIRSCLLNELGKDFLNTNRLMLVKRARGGAMKEWRYEK